MNLKSRNLLRLAVAFSVAAAFVSCNKSSKDYSKTSRGTGWSLNSKEGGFQFNPKYKEQITGPGLVFIEGGTFTMGKVQDDPLGDWNNVPTQQHVQSFYMDETEVTNLMYLEYVEHIKKEFPPDNPSYANIYDGVLPDTLVWRNRLGQNDVMVDNYLRHPAYAQYPVVGVTWLQAVEFSKWRTNRVNEFLGAQEGYFDKNARYEVEPGQGFDTDTYLIAPTLAYGGDDGKTRGGKQSQKLEKNSKDGDGLYLKRHDGVLLPEYRLPTEAEWEFAALGMSELRDYNKYRGRKKYPWEGAYTRNGNRQNTGMQMANFKQGKGDYGGIPGWSDTGADITAEVATYPPNDYGLYDMAGNVAEWVADVYRPIIDDEISDFNYFRGNIYTKNAIGEDGKVQIVTPESIVFDTLSNGRIVARTLPGQLQKTELEEQDLYLRINYSESDQRNYRDGDKASTRNFQSYGGMYEDENDFARMYNSPQHNLEKDSVGVKLQYDQNNDRRTLIDDKARVYKGGSWKDRNYWLDPAQRRYYPEDMATDFIGFRNAMSRVGSKSQNKNRTRN